MKLASEYRQHADECRALAKRMPAGDVRDHLLKMAETWERLADDREQHLPVQPDEAPKEPNKE